MHLSVSFHLLLRNDLTAAAAAAKSLQSCPTLCNPTDGSPPGSPSLGFSRQEHWSGLPFPSPMHESEKLGRVKGYLLGICDLALNILMEVTEIGT